jgi:acyl-coenzyme A thioesterase PaaI-like protein
MAEPLDSRGCLICGRDNPIGLHMTWQGDGDPAWATVVLPSTYEGFSGVAHGGVVTALLDEAMWYAIHRTVGLVTMTAAMDTRFRRPVPVMAPLYVSGRCLRTRHGLTEAMAEIRAGDASGPLLASAQGRFLPAPR